MTFTQTIKSEVLRVRGDKKCCRRSLLYGLLLFSTRFEEEKIQFTSESAETTDKVYKLLKEFYPDCKTEQYTVSAGERTEYRIMISDKDSTNVIFNDLKYADGITYKILLENFMCDSCKAAFIRGAFLSCASAIPPESGYHLEFVVSRFNLSRELLRILKICGYNAKYTKRNSHYIIYFKDSQAIVDIIAFIGAVNCSFEMTNLIIEKDIRNNCNRVVNCEAANIKRTVSSAQKHIEAIKGLVDEDKFSLLNAELQETANIRLENDDVSLGELALLHSPPVTKSCVNHRLKKICDMWKKYKSNK